MALSVGTRLGPYEVLSPLGAGGMGEVYRARDSRLKRDVAVKVLPEALSRSPDALARLEREAHAIAALSHPGILSVFDVGEEGGVRFVVTELLEGETLRALASRGPVPLKRALEVVHQLADALAAAHEKGIVHRDVKPDNVFVATDGRAKLLDFGLARASLGLRDPDGSRSPTESALTEAGAVVGTIAYMSPEQASGHPADHRSDQFSLGVVLYELLAGRRPFARVTAAETLAAIIRDEPEPLARVAPAVPAPVRWLVERLLHKEAGGRWDSTRDLTRELASLRTHLSETASTSVDAGPVGAARPRRARLALAGLAIALATAAPLTFLLLRERQGPRAPLLPLRCEIRLPDGTFLNPSRTSLALSPDGRLLVFAALRWETPYERRGGHQLYLRSLDSLESRPVAGTEGALDAVFSPDGRHVAFAAFAEGQPVLRRVPVAGGEVGTVCACDAAFGMEWGADGTILFASELGPLMRVSAAGGVPEPVTALDLAAHEISHRLPHLLPDGRTVLYTALRWSSGGSAWKRARLYATRLGEKHRSLLLEGGTDGRWAPPGILLFARDGDLLAAPLDAVSLKLTAQPVRVVAGVRHSIFVGHSGAETGAAHVALAPNGLLAWGPGSVQPPYPTSGAWLDASGRETPVGGWPGGLPVLTARVSPDGRHALLSPNYPGTHVESLDLERKSGRRATFDGSSGWAAWGPGDRITFVSDRDGPERLYTRRLDAGPEEAALLWTPPDGSGVAPGSWSRDGKVLALATYSVSTLGDVWLLEDGGPPRPFVATRFHEGWPDISPDGLWLLYASDAPGRTEVFAKALSGEGGTLQVSAGAGEEPRWSRDGTSAYYWQATEGKPGRALVRVPVTRVGRSLSFGAPVRLFDGRYNSADPGQGWDVAPDGSFLVIKPAGEAETRAFWEKVLSSRIVVDTGGVARLVAAARVGS